MRLEACRLPLAVDVSPDVVVAGRAMDDVPADVYTPLRALAAATTTAAFSHAAVAGRCRCRRGVDGGRQGGRIGTRAPVEARPRAPRIPWSGFGGAVRGRGRAPRPGSPGGRHCRPQAYDDAGGDHHGRVRPRPLLRDPRGLQCFQQRQGRGANCFDTDEAGANGFDDRRSRTTAAPTVRAPTTPRHALVSPAQAPSQMLAPGDTGSQVTILQRALAALGFSAGKPDGDYGPATQTAVERFQASKGLPQVGVVGPQTLAALQHALSRRSRR